MSFDIGALLASRAFIKSKTDAFKCKSEIFPITESMLEVLSRRNAHYVPILPPRGTIYLMSHFSCLQPEKMTGYAKWYLVEVAFSQSHAINNLQVEKR